MQRIRRAGLSPAAISRLLLAVIFSATLHTYFVFGLPWKPVPKAPSNAIAIEARLEQTVFDRSTAPRATLDSPRRLLASTDSLVSAHVPALPFALPAAGIPKPAQEISAALPVEVVAEIATPLPETPFENTGPDTLLPDLPDLVFHSVSELDVFPTLLHRVSPDLPSGTAVPGVVTLLLRINEFGKVTDTDVLDAQPEGLFEDAVTQAYRSAAFSAALIDGRPVRSRVVLRVDVIPQVGVPGR
ncbi:MAG: energy transducer TonB [Burkholderiales bacterium]